MKLSEGSQKSTWPADQPVRRRRIRVKVLAFALLLAIVLCALLGLAYQAIFTRLDKRAFPPEGEIYDVNGVAMHLYCEGKATPGKPTVIFEEGLGDDVLVWTLVQPEIGKTTLACSYDRAGMGWSEPTDAPRDSGEIALELHILLESAGIEPPYVLVAHSIGGLHARVFAGRYPDEVAGMVLVDASHPDQRERLVQAGEGVDEQRRLLNICRIATPFGLVRLINAPFLPGLPDDLQTIHLSLGSQNHVCGEVLREYDAFEASAEQTRQAGDLGDRPLVVLVAVPVIPPVEELPPGVTLADVDKALADVLVLQQEQAALSTRGKLITVEDIGHYIHLEKPQVVIDAVLEVLAELE